MRNDLRAVDLNLLKAFDALFAERAVTRAGARIGLSQPAMSAALARLRDLFDDLLFVRTPRGMEPTPRAEQLSGPIQNALREIESALRALPAFDPSSAHRVFSIGMTEYAEVALIGRAVELARKNAQHVDLRIRAIGNVEYLALLESGAIDLFVGHAAELPTHLDASVVLQDPLVLLARADHPIFQDRLTLVRLTMWPQVLVSPTGDSHGAVDDYLAQNGLERRTALTVGSYLALPAALMHSDLTANVPSEIAARLTAGTSLRTASLPFAHTVTSAMVWHRRAAGDKSHAWLRSLVAEAASGARITSPGSATEAAALRV